MSQSSSKELNTVDIVGFVYLTKNIFTLQPYIAVVSIGEISELENKILEYKHIFGLDIQVVNTIFVQESQTTAGF